MSSEIVQTGFDWNKEIAETHDLLRKFGEALKLTNEIAVQIGQKLLLFQENLPHGKFLPLLDSEFGMSRKTAYRLMDLAEAEREEPDKFVIMTNFPLYLQYELAPASMDVVKKVESGEVPATVKDIQEARKAEKEAREAQRKAEQEAEQKVASAQQQLTIFSQLSQDKISDLTQQIAALQEQIKTIETPEAIEVAPPSVLAQIEEMKTEIAKLTQQKKLISDEAVKLTTDLKELREATKAQRDQERYVAQVKDTWRKASDAIYKALSQFVGQLPSSIDLQVFEGDEWARHARTEEALAHALEKHRQLKGARYGQVVNDLPIYETSLVQVEG